MPLTLITSNISASFLTPPGVPAWDERKALYAQALREAEPSIICLQETTPQQLGYLQSQWPGMAALTVPVTDPDPAMLAAWQAKYARYGLPQPPSPYENVLFYRTESFELIDSGHWWLSPTPERPSIGFGNTAPRALLWAGLRPRAPGRDLLIFTTHIDHRCTRPMVDLCREKIAALASRAPAQILAGDLNFDPADSNYQMLLSDGWRDSAEAAATPAPATFLYDLPGIPGGRIDHILYRGTGLAPQSWARLGSPDPQRRVSDHDPVCAQFDWD